MLRCTLMAFVLATVCAVATLPVAAQQGGTVRYVYDDNGRLHAVILPSGEANVYEYDAAGNITEIRRTTMDALEIFTFTPREGQPGDLVTFTGVGFGADVNGVSFNGVAGRIVSSDASTVIAEVPEGATTGRVTITTPRGSAITADPFTIKGLRLTPRTARVNFGESLQFTAEVIGESDQIVTWSVNGITNGNQTLGTISATGLYTAPQREGAVTIRATSVADNARTDEASVIVRNPNDVQAVLSASVSVMRGTNVGKVSVAPPVAVQYGLQGDSYSASATSVSVQKGNASGVTTALSQSVSIQRGESGGGITTMNAPVSVRYGSESGIGEVSSPAVSATTGPHIASITPERMTRGATVTLTISGANLTGATVLRFISAGGSNDSSIVFSNLTTNPEGTVLTATLSIGTNASLGRRVIVVSTPGGDTLRVDVTSNTIEIVAP